MRLYFLQNKQQSLGRIYFKFISSFIDLIGKAAKFKLFKWNNTWFLDCGWIKKCNAYHSYFSCYLCWLDTEPHCHLKFINVWNLYIIYNFTSKMDKYSKMLVMKFKFTRNIILYRVISISRNPVRHCVWKGVELRKINVYYS